MVKEEFITKVCRKAPYSRSMVTAVLDIVLDTIEKEVASGQTVQFAGFGTFEPKKCAARTGRNPHTNEEVPIPARVVPNFRAGKYFKDAVIRPAKL